MNEQDIVNKLKSDPRALKSVMQSQDGQALLQMLSGGNSAALGQAEIGGPGGAAARLRRHDGTEPDALPRAVQSAGRGAGAAAGKPAPAVTERRTQRVGIG